MRTVKSSHFFFIKILTRKNLCVILLPEEVIDSENVH